MLVNRYSWFGRLCLRMPFWLLRIESARVGYDHVSFLKVKFCINWKEIGK